MHKNLSILLSSLLMSALCLSPTQCKDGSTLKVATVNPNKILEAYPKAQQMLQELSKAEADLNKKIMAKKEVLDRAKAANKTETELQMLKEQMRLEIEPEAKKLEEDSNKRSAEIEQNIDTAIKLVVQDQQFDVVMMQDAVLYGATDITDIVLGKLGK